jgi:uncharacterized membrane protein
MRNKNNKKAGKSDKSLKKEMDGRKKTLILVFTTVILISIGQIMMKKGMSTIALKSLSSVIELNNLITIFTNPYVFLGFAIYGISMILWLSAMSRADVSLIFPLLSTGYIITTIFAIIFLGEHASLIKWASIGLIFAGSFFVGKS